MLNAKTDSNTVRSEGTTALTRTCKQMDVSRAMTYVLNKFHSDMTVHNWAKTMSRLRASTSPSSPRSSKSQRAHRRMRPFLFSYLGRRPCPTATSRSLHIRWQFMLRYVIAAGVLAHEPADLIPIRIRDSRLKVLQHPLGRDFAVFLLLRTQNLFMRRLGERCIVDQTALRTASHQGAGR